MNRFILISFFAIGITSCSLGNDIVDGALHNAITNSCVSQRRVAIGISEWGVPEMLFSEPAFTNFVSILSANVNNCDVSYISSLTGIVERAVFVAALTECGTTTYKNAVVTWFGNSLQQIPNNTAIINSFISPIGTNFEDYMPMHYDTLGISNVLNNAKALHLATSNTVEVAAIERMLSGESKQSLIQNRDNGLIDRIRDGTAD